MHGYSRQIYQILVRDCTNHMIFGSGPPRRIWPSTMSWKSWGGWQGRNGWNGWNGSNGWNGQDWRSDSTTASASKKPFWRRFVDASEDPAVIQWCRQRIQQFLDSGSSQENVEWLGNETQTWIRRSFLCFKGGLSWIQIYRLLWWFDLVLSCSFISKKCGERTRWTKNILKMTPYWAAIFLPQTAMTAISYWDLWGISEYRPILGTWDGRCMAQGLQGRLRGLDSNIMGLPVTRSNMIQPPGQNQI